MSGTDATYSRHLRPYVSDFTAGDPPAVAAIAHPQSPEHDSVGPELSQGQWPVIFTRSGRASRPSSLYKDFVTDQFCDVQAH